MLDWVNLHKIYPSLKYVEILPIKILVGFSFYFNPTLTCANLSYHGPNLFPV